MLNNSVVKNSGQLWKLFIALALLVLGSIAPLFESLGISITSGTAIAVVGYAFGLLAIRCAECRSLWFWEAAKDASWYLPLFKQSSCPKCHKEF
jgi:hypothetical protein